jgi:hypothetical protein
MCAKRAVLFLMMLSALGGITSCSRTQTSAHQESAPPYVPPDISQETLNSLLRQNSQEMEPAPEVKLWAHKVRHRRETLFSIALWYTGSGMNWPRLAEVNPDIDPKRIRIGDTIFIPAALIKTRRPMPAGYPNPKRKHPKIKKPESPSANLPATNEAPALFGPIENDSQPGEPANNELPAPMETLDQ